VNHPQQAVVNPLTLNDHYSGRTAPLTSKSFTLYIYSTNIGTEYFKHGIYSPFLSLQNAVYFIILTYLVRVLFTFYIQDVLKLKKKSGAKRLRHCAWKISYVYEGNNWHMHGYTAQRTNIQTCETTEIHYKGTACVLRKSQERGFL
jgi:hypothetical protein